MTVNYDGLAELGWRGAQWIDGKNGYHDWERLTKGEQQHLKLQYANLGTREKLKPA